jgi:hypothetical protein
MELFIVTNTRTGKVAAEGFLNRKDAKAKRDLLQVEAGGLPPADQRQVENLWSYKVSKIKDPFLKA